MTNDTQTTPRWVKVAGIVALAVVLLAVIVLVTGRGGGHGPGRHTPPGDRGHTPPTGAHTQP